MEPVVQTSRIRLAIAAVLALGYGYYHVSGGSAALASIGLIAFLGVAQVLPALLGGIFWRGATRMGAILGLVTGLTVWAYTSFLPSFGPGAALPEAVFTEGLMGLSWLQSLQTTLEQFPNQLAVIGI